MKDNTLIRTLILCFLIISTLNSGAQYIEMDRPAEWENLVYGGRFMDNFLPVPVPGELTYDTWGAENVIPRYVQNGIEDNEWSYWGGNILAGDDGKYHLYVCRWREDAPKGHMEWPNSIVVHATSDNSIGPFTVSSSIGKGHNPEAFKLSDGRIVIYVIDGYYISDNMYGPWEYRKFEFEPRDRPIIEGLSNLSFAQREDGSFLMVCRGGGIWISKDGLSPYYQVTAGSVYPDVEGRFEDPVIWKTGIQYHLIVNDWYGRIAYHLRSKDGVNWKTDPGEAYLPGITVYTDGTRENWFKYERMKVLQDKSGRPVQANFAVIDTLKHEDMPNDKHSSKNIGIPLAKERFIEFHDKNRINSNTKSFRVTIKAEDGFNPHADVDIESLRFGDPETVNYGGGSRALKTTPSGRNLIVTFEGAGNEITDKNFTAKLLGKTTSGKLLFGYARLPWIDYNEAILSARLPAFANESSGGKLFIEVQNFGQVHSEKSTVTIDLQIPDQKIMTVTGNIPRLHPYESIMLELPYGDKYTLTEAISVTVTLRTGKQVLEVLKGQLKIKHH